MTIDGHDFLNLTIAGESDKGEKSGTKQKTNSIRFFKDAEPGENFEYEGLQSLEGCMELVVLRAMTCWTSCVR